MISRTRQTAFVIIALSLLFFLLIPALSGADQLPGTADNVSAGEEAATPHSSSFAPPSPPGNLSVDEISKYLDRFIFVNYPLIHYSLAPQDDGTYQLLNFARQGNVLAGVGVRFPYGHGDYWFTGIEVLMDATRLSSSDVGIGIVQGKKLVGDEYAKIIDGMYITIGVGWFPRAVIERQEMPDGTIIESEAEPGVEAKDFALRLGLTANINWVGLISSIAGGAE